MRTFLTIALLLITVPAYAQITIGKYRISGSVEFSADVEIEEIQDVTIPDPIAFWKLDDLTSSVGDFNLTNVNGVTFAGGKIGDAGYFDRPSGQYLKIANASAGDLVKASSFFTDGFTVAAWVYPVSTPVFGRSYIVVGTRALSGNGWNLGIGSGFGGNTNAYVSGVGTEVVAGAAAKNAWNFIAWRYRSADGEVDIYLNSASAANTLEVPGWAASTNDFNIGAGANSELVSMDGRIDATGIWNVALSDAQIAELYNSGNGVELPIAIPQDATSFRQVKGTPETIVQVDGTEAIFQRVLGTPETIVQVDGSRN